MNFQVFLPSSILTFNYILLESLSSKRKEGMKEGYIYIYTYIPFTPRFEGRILAERRNYRFCLVKISRQGRERVFVCPKIASHGDIARPQQREKRRQQRDCSRHRWKTRFRVFPGKTFSMVEQRSFQRYLFENLIILPITRELLTHEGRGRGSSVLARRKFTLRCRFQTSSPIL